MNTRTVVIAGVAVGLAYTLSPLTALFAVALMPLCRWAVSGIDGAERRWLVRLLAAAIVLRVAAIVLLVLTTDPNVHQIHAFVPDARNAIARSWWVRNQWLGIDIGPLNRLRVNNVYGATSYVYILAALQLVFGEAPYAVNFMATLAFLVAAVALYRVSRQSYGSSIAMIGLAILLFWPTMIVWSASALRECFQLALTATVFVAVVHTVRGRAPMYRIAALVLLAVALAAVYTTRAGAFAIVTGGLGIALAGHAVSLRPAVARAAGAAMVILAAWAITQPSIQQRFVDLMRPAVMRHVGEVATPGNAYKVLEYRFYVDSLNDIINTLTPAEALDFAIRSAAAFIVVPLPWQLASATELVFLPQQVCWLLLIACAVIGAAAGFRRDPLLTWLLVGYFIAGLVVIAPYSGNIGTLVRHRDIVMASVAWLGAAGLCSIAAWAERRRGAPVPIAPELGKAMA